MGKIYRGVTELTGGTPLMEAVQIERKERLQAKLLLKLEYFNPTGSVKDRAAKYMIEQAERDGSLKPGSVIIEPTSGNTGIGLAAVAAVKGYQLILTMPETMSLERRNLLKAYGAELVLTDGKAGMREAMKKAKELAREFPDSFIPGQFENPANAQAHRETTGPEIWRDTEGMADVLVSGVGSGGTITGAGEYLRSQNPGIYIVAAEPSDSPVLSGGKPGSHGIQGIGAGFIPEVLNQEIYDEVILVETAQALETSKELAKTEGLLTGISSGAALYAAISLARRPEFAGKQIVVILPDSGDRYYSTPLFTEE